MNGGGGWDSGTQSYFTYRWGRVRAGGGACTVRNVTLQTAPPLPYSPSLHNNVRIQPPPHGPKLHSLRSLPFQCPKKSRFPGTTPFNGYCPNQNHYVPRHINNRYIKITNWVPGTRCHMHTNVKWIVDCYFAWKYIKFLQKGGFFLFFIMFRTLNIVNKNYFLATKSLLLFI